MSSSSAMPAEGDNGHTEEPHDTSVEYYPEAADAASQEYPIRSELSVVVFGFEDPDSTDLRMDAGEFEELTNRLGNMCAVAASEFGGKLINRLNGGKVIVFGVPEVKELDAERAVLAAQKVLRSFDSSQNNSNVQLRCGIASGEGFVLPDNGPSLSPQDVSGKVFQAAERLERNAPGNTLLVAPEVRALLRSEFNPRRVKINDGAGEAYEISQSYVSMSRFKVGELENRLSAFTGRTMEMNALASAWNTAKIGTFRSVLIEGEPGIGKSRLVHAFLRKTTADQPLVLNFYGSVHHKRTPFFPVAQGLCTFLGLKSQNSPSLLASVVRNLLVDLKLDTKTHNANLKAILKSGGLGSPSPRTDLAADKPTETLIACFERLSEIHPMILVFEDAHWMDNSSLALFADLCRALERRRVLVLVSRRLQAGTEKLSSLASQTIRVSHLSESQTRLLAGHLRPQDMSEDHFDHIVKRSDGIPLFLEELMNIAVERGSAFFEERKETLIPASLRETLAARISHLGASREVLLAAAAIGKVFDKRLLADVAGLSQKKIAKHLAAFQVPISSIVPGSRRRPL